MISKINYCLAVLMIALFSTTASAADKVNALEQLMVYRNFIQDAPDCSLTVKKGKPIFNDAVASSAASTCPDAFAWAQFATAIQQEFWNWGIDQTVWPSEPWPLCDSKNSKNCCDPNKSYKKGAPELEHCPLYRADIKPIPPLPATPNGTASGNVINHRGLRSDDAIDPGRLLRDLELELVFRNKPMVDYIFKHDLYNTEGLGKLNQQQNDAIKKGDIGLARRLQVRFPVDAVMVKADFIHQSVMLETGLIQKYDDKGVELTPPQNPDFPYVTVEIKGDGKKGEQPGIYYMVAMTNASKDIPIWHWYAMEHVANRGRCDYIGCNDSFGYTVDAKTSIQAGSHFTPPHTEYNNDKSSGNDPLFVTGKTYLPDFTGEQITGSLQKLLKGMGVGIDKDIKNYKQLSAKSPAWLNYRLKGTQTTFTSADGVPSGTGATVTEGGFVNSASCTTCHSQAAVNKKGKPTLSGVGGTWRPNLLGYQQVQMGAPNIDWFYSPGTTTITASQVDFVWGILNAKPLTTSKSKK